jgi:hypothetical protein
MALNHGAKEPCPSHGTTGSRGACQAGGVCGPVKPGDSGRWSDRCGIPAWRCKWVLCQETVRRDKLMTPIAFRRCRVPRQRSPARGWCHWTAHRCSNGGARGRCACEASEACGLIKTLPYIVAVELLTDGSRPGSAGGHYIANGPGRSVLRWPRGGTPVALERMVVDLFALGYKPGGAGNLATDLS